MLFFDGCVPYGHAISYVDKKYDKHLKHRIPPLPAPWQIQIPLQSLLVQLNQMDHLYYYSLIMEEAIQFV
jgi:hypothetical protein